MVNYRVYFPKGTMTKAFGEDVSHEELMEKIFEVNDGTGNISENMQPYMDFLKKIIEDVLRREFNVRDDFGLIWDLKIHCIVNYNRLIHCHVKVPAQTALTLNNMELIQEIPETNYQVEIHDSKIRMYKSVMEIDISFI